MADAHNGVALVVVLVVLLLLSLAGCGPGGDDTTGGNTTPTQLALVAGEAGIASLVPQVARVEIEISGPDIATQTNSVPVSNLSSGQEIPLTVNAPLGDNRTVRVRAFDGNNRLLFSGKNGVSLPSSTQVEIRVFLPFRVTVNQNGNGTVTSSPPGFPCGANCLDFDHDTPATFTASAAPGSVFTGWSGACSGTGPCVIDQTATITATFTAAPDAVTLNVTVVGPGTVTSSPSGISCNPACSAGFAPGTSVTLAATPTGGATFAGWGGACSGTGGCTVVMNGNQTVTATFTVAPSTAVLTLNKQGAGTGTVTSSPPGISCGPGCTSDTGTYATGTSVTLTAAPATGSVFVGWSVGGCGGVTCVVTMNGNQTVTATFAPAPPSTATLTVAKAGAGSGTVTSSPGGINCGGDCSESYPLGTTVTLTAAPAGGSTFAGWSGGGCGGTGSCVVTMNANQTVTATFIAAPPPPPPSTATLTVAKAGTGSGTVTSSPGGINCGGDCSNTYTIGTVVTLTASPAGGSTFAGWSGGGCSGTGSCAVAMTGNQTVTATFTASSPPPPSTAILTVNKSGPGNGTVTSSPPGIDCGAVCTFSFPLGTTVTLTAVPDGDSDFDDWSGSGCNGDGLCVVVMSMNRTVTARFDED